MFLQVTWLLCLICAVHGCHSGDYSLLNKTVIVTGAARGIGYAIADNFLAEGAKTIIIVDKNITSGISAAKTLNSKYGCDRAVFVACHVFRDDYCWDYIKSTNQQIDILVNNAAILDEYDTTEMVMTNVAAVITWSFNFRDDCRTDRKGPGGTIINISSGAGYQITPFITAYSATKYATKAFTEDFGHDYNCKRTGVRVVGICPHLTYTEMTRQQMVEDFQVEDFEKVREKSPWQTADDVGRATVAVYKTAATGTLWTVSGGKCYKAPDVEYTSTEDIKRLSI